MNNTELLTQFHVIAGKSNIFDICCELKKFNKQYKKSEFYKQTKLPINSAYKIFVESRGLAMYNKLNE